MTSFQLSPPLKDTRSIISLLNEEEEEEEEENQQTSLPTPSSPSTEMNDKVLSNVHYSTFSVRTINSTSNNNYNNHNHNNNNNKNNNNNSKKLYQCDQCLQTFNRLNNLKSHRTTHTTERPYQCNQCKANFRRQHDLKRHQKLHTGEKPFQCSKCFRKFARLDALNRHQRVEGGTACYINKRPLIPEINIPSPSTTTNIHHHTPTHEPLLPVSNLLTLPWSPTSRTLPSPIQDDNLTTTSSPSTISLSTPSPSIDTLPLVNKSDYDLVKKELENLKLQYQQLQNDFSLLENNNHDLKVENKLLTSLILSSKGTSPSPPPS